MNGRLRIIDKIAALVGAAAIIVGSVMSATGSTKDGVLFILVGVGIVFLASLNHQLRRFPDHPILTTRRNGWGQGGVLTTASVWTALGVLSLSTGAGAYIIGGGWLWVSIASFAIGSICFILGFGQFIQWWRRS